MRKKILTAGEPMGLFIAKDEGLLEDVRQYSTSVAGAEFNVAVGLSRLGHHAGYLTKLGKDPFGRQILKVMNQNGINTKLTISIADHATGFMLKSKTACGDPDIYYYRKNSAASTISPDDLGEVKLEEWDAIHLTGILPAISETARETTYFLMREARRVGIPIFFDPNIRPQLWSSQEQMIQSINKMAAMADYVMPGENEGEILCGSRDPEVIGEFYRNLGVKVVIVKTGADGAHTYTEDGNFHTPAFPPLKIVDTVGAGDGFAAGVVSGLMEGLSIQDSVQRGCAIGTIQIMHVSDNEGLPTQEELDHYLQENRQVAK